MLEANFLNILMQKQEKKLLALYQPYIGIKLKRERMEELL
jgi:hypothetical protein